LRRIFARYSRSDNGRILYIRALSQRRIRTKRQVGWGGVFETSLKHRFEVGGTKFKNAVAGCVERWRLPGFTGFEQTCKILRIC